MPANTLLGPKTSVLDFWALVFMLFVGTVVPVVGLEPTRSFMSPGF